MITMTHLEMNLLWCWQKKDPGNTEKVDRKTYIFKWQKQDTSEPG